MCLIVFAWQHHPDYALVLAANRDEFYERPTQRAQFWAPEHPDLLAGRDLRSGGTWLGVTRSGRFAAITNVREPGHHRPDAPSRGHLVSGFLTADAAPRAYLEALAGEAEAYNGFNLLVGTPAEMAYVSNRGGGVQRIPPGVYGLSNHRLDTPWPKVRAGKAMLTDALEQDGAAPERLARSLLDRLHDPTPAPEEALPDTGVGLAWERLLSPMHIVSPTYGTRAASVLLIRHDGQVLFAERTYGPDGTRPPDGWFRFRVKDGRGGKLR